MKARTWTLASTAFALALLANEVSAQSPAAPSKTAATVNGEAIPLEDVDAILKRQPPPPQPLTEAQRRQVRMEIVDMLIDDVLMQQFLRKSGVQVEAADVKKELANLEASLKSQHRSLQEFCRDTGQSEAQVRTNIANMLQWASYVKGRTNEADIERYYQENKDFFDQVTVRASHVLIRVPANGSEGNRQAAAAKLKLVHEEIVAGKLDFGDAVKKYSQCPSATNGGDIGFFPRKWAVAEPFAKAAFSLKVGEVSDVVHTDYGVHLIKVTDRKNGTASSYDKIKDEVRENYVQDMRQALIEQQRKAAQVEVNLP